MVRNTRTSLQTEIRAIYREIHNQSVILEPKEFEFYQRIVNIALKRAKRAAPG